jgi:hypothetical protein
MALMTLDLETRISEISQRQFETRKVIGCFCWLAVLDEKQRNVAAVV